MARFHPDSNAWSDRNDDAIQTARGGAARRHRAGLGGVLGRGLQIASRCAERETDRTRAARRRVAMCRDGERRRCAARVVREIPSRDIHLCRRRRLHESPARIERHIFAADRRGERHRHRPRTPHGQLDERPGHLLPRRRSAPDLPRHVVHRGRATPRRLRDQGRRRMSDVRSRKDCTGDARTGFGGGSTGDRAGGGQTAGAEVHGSRRLGRPVPQNCGREPEHG